MGNIRGLDENKRISTLNSLIKPSLTLYRANGNTTRQVDYAIQLLFDGHLLYAHVFFLREFSLAYQL